jgi:Uma2 family endonuclease
MATAASPLTLEQFYSLPDPENGYYELHEGEPVLMPFPSVLHSYVQDDIVHALHRRLSGFGRTSKEFPYAPTARNYRSGDVVVVSHTRLSGIDWTRSFAGSPDLVIEVASPSNSASKLRSLEKLCLETGAREFWVVYPDLGLVEVCTPGWKHVSYEYGSLIPLDSFGCPDSLPVDEIFVSIKGSS